jgi:hypothetical protein
VDDSGRRSRPRRLILSHYFGGPADTLNMTIFVRGIAAAALLVVCARPAAAQMYELVGTRAQGMGGAFVAVADDATATWWNPAGIATGATLSLIYDRSENTAPMDPAASGPAWLGKSTGFAFASPAMGLSYYRLRISEIQPLSSNGGAASGRQEEGATGLDLRTFALSEFGATVGQSLGDHLVIGSTLKLVRIGRALALDPGSASTAADRLEAAGSADVSSETDTDLDLGAMASFSRVRVGVSLKHLRQPDFGEGDSRLTLKRQARVGMAVIGGGAGPLTSITAAVDADLTRLATTLGEVRHLAAGAEAWLFERRLGLRGGISANTTGDETKATSVGASLGSRGGYYVDGYLTVGSDPSREGWGLSIRLSF